MPLPLLSQQGEKQVNESSKAELLWRHMAELISVYNGYGSKILELFWTGPYHENTSLNPFQKGLLKMKEDLKDKNLGSLALWPKMGHMTSRLNLLRHREHSNHAVLKINVFILRMSYNVHRIVQHI